MLRGVALKYGLKFGLESGQSGSDAEIVEAGEQRIPAKGAHARNFSVTVGTNLANIHQVGYVSRGA